MEFVVVSRFSKRDLFSRILSRIVPRKIKEMIYTDVTLNKQAIVQQLRHEGKV